jgi:probable Rubsico expression protein CbbX
MSPADPPRPTRSTFGLARGPLDSADNVDSDPEANARPTLDSDARVDLQAALTDSGIADILTKLDADLVGLVQVKTRIREIAALLLVEVQRSRFDLPGSRPSLHMSFTGSPGTGKTTVALRMAAMLHRLGYCRRDHVVVATRDDLVGQYVGHTAPKTKELLKRAMGGVLFIDEAYYLYKAENERDYGSEAIEILLQVMESSREDLVVIFAGYPDRMNEFFASNPGLGSRVAHHIDFPDYDIGELVEIADLMIDHEGYRLSDDARPVVREYLERRSLQPRFANARSVRNAIERARLRQANRLLAQGGTVGRDDLMTLEPADLLASRVFNEPEAESSTDV